LQLFFYFFTAESQTRLPRLSPPQADDGGYGLAENGIFYFFSLRRRKEIYCKPFGQIKHQRFNSQLYAQSSLLPRNDSFFWFLASQQKPKEILSSAFSAPLR
jgi:hypothetical protein